MSKRDRCCNPHSGEGLSNQGSAFLAVRQNGPTSQRARQAACECKQTSNRLLLVVPVVYREAVQCCGSLGSLLVPHRQTDSESEGLSYAIPGSRKPRTPQPGTPRRLNLLAPGTSFGRVRGKWLDCTREHFDHRLDGIGSMTLEVYGLCSSLERVCFGYLYSSTPSVRTSV